MSRAFTGLKRGRALCYEDVEGHIWDEVLAITMGGSSRLATFVAGDYNSFAIANTALDEAVKAGEAFLGFAMLPRERKILSRWVFDDDSEFYILLHPDSPPVDSHGDDCTCRHREATARRASTAASLALLAKHGDHEPLQEVLLAISGYFRPEHLDYPKGAPSYLHEDGSVDLQAFRLILGDATLPH